MMWRVLVVAVLVLAIAGCGRKTSQAPPPQETPAAAPAPATPAPDGAPATPAPGAPAAPESLPAYPGAKQTSSSSFSGTGPSGTAGQWTIVVLETTDPFEKVRDFYKANAPKGFAQSFATEQSDAGGRNFALWFARTDQKAWHTITVEEDKAAGKVTITLGSGLAP